MAPRVERRLAAILALDVVGYSRLRGEDEAGMYIDKFTKEDNAKARQLFEKAVELKLNYGRARSKLVITYQLDYALGWSASPEKLLQQGVELALTAVAADESDNWAHWALGLGYLYQKRHDRALAEFDRAVALNPNDADVLSDHGWTLAYAGKPRDGIDEIKKAVLLNPYYPGWYIWNVGMA